MKKQKKCTPVGIKVFRCDSCKRSIRRSDGVVKEFHERKAVDVMDDAGPVSCDKCGNLMTFENFAIGCKCSAS